MGGKCWGSIISDPPSLTSLLWAYHLTSAEPCTGAGEGSATPVGAAATADPVGSDASGSSASAAAAGDGAGSAGASAARVPAEGSARGGGEGPRKAAAAAYAAATAAARRPLVTARSTAWREAAARGGPHRGGVIRWRGGWLAEGWAAADAQRTQGVAPLVPKYWGLGARPIQPFWRWLGAACAGYVPISLHFERFRRVSGSVQPQLTKNQGQKIENSWAEAQPNHKGVWIFLIWTAA